MGQRVACKHVTYWELGQRVECIGMWCHCEFDIQAAFKCGVSGSWVSVLPVKMWYPWELDYRLACKCVASLGDESSCCVRNIP